MEYIHSIANSSVFFTKKILALFILVGLSSCGGWWFGAFKNGFRVVLLNPKQKQSTFLFWLIGCF